MGARGPKPGFRQARQLVAAASVAAVAATTAAAVAEQEAPTVAEEPVCKDPLQRSREIRTMEHAELRAYAKQIGVRQRDIDELSADRLRQNCMLTVASLIAAYTD